MDSSDRNYSSLSEFENLSDSDWLDVASSRASEDDDSLAGFEDSDREDIDGRPESRHSFTSYSSSRDEVVAWEGLIDDGSDLEAPLTIPDRSELNSSLNTDVARPDTPDEDDDPEDERVKAALDQSMMSTLSSSRSNSLANSMQASMGNSTRLRLSFPDPTTSKPESLTTSYEKLSRSKTKEHTTSSATVYADIVTAEPAADPGMHPTPAVLADNASEEEDLMIAASRVKPDLRVVLYGASPLAKDSLVQMLLNKLARGTGQIRAQTVHEAPRVVSYLYNARESKIWKSPLRSICVVDKTGLAQSRTFLEPDCPSLAVVFLPCFDDISVFDHTLYLPVMISSPLTVVDLLTTTDYLLEAEQQWEDTGIPSDKLTSLSQLSAPVVDQETLESASPAQIHQAFRPLIPTSVRKSATQVSAYALSIMAVLSIVLGYVVHGCIDSQSSLHKMVVGHNSGKVLPPTWWAASHTLTIEANKSSPVPLLSMSPPGTAMSASSLKDFAVAVFNPATLTAVPVLSDPQPVASSSSPTPSSSHVANDAPSECDCGCGLLTWPGKTDVMVRPSASSSALSSYGNGAKSVSVISAQHYPIHASKDKGKARETVPDADTSLYALSTRLVTSLSEYFDFDFAAAKKETDKNLQDLMDACDHLMQVIARQTAMIWEQSRGTVNVLRGGLRERNEHARMRARQVREAGVQWLTSVHDIIKEHAEVANRNAKTIKEKLAQGEHVGKASKAWEDVLSSKTMRKLAREGRRYVRKERKHAKEEEKRSKLEQKLAEKEKKVKARLEKKLEKQEKKQAKRMQRFLRAAERAGF
ncbi:hypothetical protein NM688_g1503 [Phlebia brevispora]|uniref:Uncharacterized protein n=1 Tax=Phlebia brevispora TaxID=194682 RepID=A0ACC1TBF3_9APHY|nr:hypothetical protein NM688_g1503 [Phlebia brevispora]